MVTYDITNVPVLLPLEGPDVRVDDSPWEPEDGGNSPWEPDDGGDPDILGLFLSHIAQI